jgi:hypothetical protein
LGARDGKDKAMTIGRILYLSLGVLFQLIGMASDLILIAAVWYLAYVGFGLLAVIFAFGVNGQVQKTGGWFFSWYPENARAFWRNWKDDGGPYWRE